MQGTHAEGLPFPHTMCVFEASLHTTALLTILVHTCTPPPRQQRPRQGRPRFQQL